MLRFVFIALLVAVSCADESHDHENHCPTSFSSRKCSRSTNEEAAMAALHEVCSEVPFATGCTVHRACHATDTNSKSCHPFNVVLAVCHEFDDLEICIDLESDCGSLEELTACDGVVDLQLPRTQTAFEAVREICDEQMMNRCDECHDTQADPTNSNQRSRFANACMDPLGTWSSICMEMDMIACDQWKEWCALETSMPFSSLCKEDASMQGHSDHDHASGDGHDHTAGNESMSAVDNSEEDSMSISEEHDHSEHDHSEHDHSETNEEDSMPEAHDHSSHDNTGHDHSMEGGSEDSAVALLSGDDNCIQDPTDASCEGYMLPLDFIEEDILSLCVADGTSMPWMTGCSIRNACRDMDSNSDLCAPFSLLSTLCTDMPGMVGCRRYNSLCSSDSVVQQCTTVTSIPWAPRTMRTQERIVAACSDHSMSACYQCPAVGASCPTTLETMSELCFMMPSMQFCNDHRRFCSATNGVFGRFCDPSDGDFLPPMRMYFHFGQRDIILFKDWIPESTAGYTLSFLAIVCLGIVLHAIKAVRLLCENRWYRELSGATKADCHTCIESNAGCDRDCHNDCGDKCGKEKFLPEHANFHKLQRNVIRAVLTGVATGLEFLLMLIAMTFNVGLFIAVITGVALGVLFFGHVVENDYVVSSGPLSHQTARRPGMEGGCCG